MGKAARVFLAVCTGAVIGLLVGFWLGSTQASSGDWTVNGPHEVHVLGVIESYDSSAIEIRSCNYIGKGELVSFSIDSQKTAVTTELTPGKYVYVTYLFTPGQEDPEPGRQYFARRIEDAGIP